MISVGSFQVYGGAALEWEWYSKIGFTELAQNYLAIRSVYAEGVEYCGRFKWGYGENKGG